MLADICTHTGEKLSFFVLFYPLFSFWQYAQKSKKKSGVFVQKVKTKKKAKKLQKLLEKQNKSAILLLPLEKRAIKQTIKKRGKEAMFTNLFIYHNKARKEAERKEAERKEAERKEAERKEAEREAWAMYEAEQEFIRINGLPKGLN